jgi:hypothetical protein
VKATKVTALPAVTNPLEAFDPFGQALDALAGVVSGEVFNGGTTTNGTDGTNDGTETDSDSQAPEVRQTGGSGTSPAPVVNVNLSGLFSKPKRKSGSVAPAGGAGKEGTAAEAEE